MHCVHYNLSSSGFFDQSRDMKEAVLPGRHMALLKNWSPSQPCRFQQQTRRATKQSAPPPASEDEQKTRFRWNPAQSRWERVKASRDKEGKYSVEKWEEGGVSSIQTRTGGSYTVWPIIHAYLTDEKLQSLTPTEAYERQQERGAVLVDCRVAWDFDKQHIEGAKSVPLFRGVAGKTAWDTIKRGVMAVGFAMRATERNPDFLESAAQQLPKNKEVIVYCGLGGTILVGAQPYKPGGKSFKDDPERMFGRESRSLKACYELLQAGYKNVTHLQGGLSQWRHDGFPVS